jgi:diaminopimelate epimerase
MTHRIEIPFVKMHGAGNDYVLVAGADVRQVLDIGALAREMSDRRKGIGSDGLIVVRPAPGAAARMEMYNADGSRSAMCGNGLRLVARYAESLGLVKGDRFRLESDAGAHDVELLRGKELDTRGARVSMGAPVAEPARIPLRDPAARTGASGFPEIALPFGDKTLTGTCLSVGNPHCVVFVADVRSVPVETWGRLLELDPRFPDRVNVEFAAVVEPGVLLERTWERGAGETHSCGSGACAAAVAAIASGRARGPVEVRQLGGSLEVAWSPGGEILLTGPAVEAFRGEWIHVPPVR